jgi:alpha-L-fucosidase
MIWHDFAINRIAAATVLQHLAYYYNKSADWNKDVVVAFKDGMTDKGQIYDFERNTPTTLVGSHYWETDESTGSHWNETTDTNSYFSAVNIMHNFFDQVSKNGNLLLNFGPAADGSISVQIKNILYAMGSWLHKFGETIYCTRAWTVFGEGTTTFGTGTYMGSNGYSDPKKAGTSSDIRYTISKDKNNLFAIFMGWPGGTRTLKSVTTASFPLGAAATVYLYGETPATATKLNFTQSSTGLQVTFPASAPYTALAYAIKISLIGEAPKAPPPKTPLAASDAVFTTALKDSGQQVTAVKALPAVNRSLIGPMVRIYCNTGLTREGITVPYTATSMEIYSIQGKRLFKRDFNGNHPDVYRFEDFKAPAVGTFYIKFN